MFLPAHAQRVFFIFSGFLLFRMFFVPPNLYTGEKENHVGIDAAITDTAHVGAP